MNDLVPLFNKTYSKFAIDALTIVRLYVSCVVLPPSTESQPSAPDLRIRRLRDNTSSSNPNRQIVCKLVRCKGTDNHTVLQPVLTGSASTHTRTYESYFELFFASASISFQSCRICHLDSVSNFAICQHF